MTVTLAGDQGDLQAWESVRFAATVNGAGALVYARTQDMHLESDSPWFVIDTPAEQSILKFTYDEPVTIVVSIADGSADITSANIYPTRDDVTLTVAGGTATIVLPVDPLGIDLWFDANDNRQDPLHIFAQPPLDGVQIEDINGQPATTSWATIGPKTVSSIDTTANTITTSTAHGWSVGQKVHFYSAGTYPTTTTTDLNSLDVYYVKTAPTTTSVTLSRTSGGATIDLTGAGSGTRTLSTASWSATDSALYFPAGEHRIGMLFALGDDTEVYLDHGAVVIGSIDLRGTDGAFVHGPGVLAGTFSGPQEGAAFFDGIPYSMFYGYDGTTPGFYADNKVEGITIFAAPWYANFWGVWSWRYVTHITPWDANTGQWLATPRTELNKVAEFYRCYSYQGDDGFDFANPIGTLTADKCVSICSANGAPWFMSASYRQTTGTYTATITDCHAMTLAGPDPGGFDEWPFRGFTAIVKAWVDAPSGSYGSAAATFTNLKVWGPMRARFCEVSNLPYVYVGSGDGKGYASGLVFDGLEIQQTPGQVSHIAGLDANNHPQGIEFRRVRIGGVPVSARNFSTFFTVDETVTNLTVDGKAIA